MNAKRATLRTFFSWCFLRNRREIVLVEAMILWASGLSRAKSVLSSLTVKDRPPSDESDTEHCSEIRRVERL